MFLIFSCSDKKAESYSLNPNDTLPKHEINSDSAATITAESTVEINFNFFYINSKNDLDSFRSIYSESERRIISDLNRIDEWRIKPVDSLVVPDTLADLFFYSPFPRTLSSAKEINKILFISRRIQALAGYENGKLVRWAPVSTGKKSTPTPDGLFFTNWRAKSTISTVNPDWKMDWYFNIHNFRGISIHKYDMPGYPASHACVRLKEEDALWFYEWAEQWVLNHNQQSIIAYGTPVIIYDEYDFDEPLVWKKLVYDSNITQQSSGKLDTLLQDHIELIIERQKSRVETEAEVL